MSRQPFISFARGAPSLDLVDVAGLKAAAIRAFDTDPGGLTSYGTSVGYPPLRRWIAEKHQVAVDRVLVTNGSLQADAFVFDHLVRAGDEVVVERPTYDRTLLNLQQRDARVHQVGMDAGGLDTGELRKLLESGMRPVLAHVIPNYQNPAGKTLSLDRRTELLALAAEFGFTVFEDDPYVDIRFRGPRLPTLLSLDTAGLVLHASSFTKTVCPGVRVGYLIGPAPVIAEIARQATNLYISPSQVAEGIVYQFCVGGDIGRSVQTMCQALSDRSAALADALRRHLPQASFTEPDGGYFLWVELADTVDVERLQPQALARGVGVVKGTDFLLDGGRHALRLAFSAVRLEEIEPGVQRLAEAIRAVQT